VETRPPASLQWNLVIPSGANFVIPSVAKRSRGTVSKQESRFISEAALLLVWRWPDTRPAYHTARLGGTGVEKEGLEPSALGVSDQHLTMTSPRGLYPA
jgi:hypothetical protein